MKWLFAILVALNLIVFAAMIGVKLLNKHLPAAETAAAPAQQPQQPTQVIINTANPTAAAQPGVSGAANVIRRPAAAPAAPAPKTPAAPAKPRAAEETAAPRTQHKACSARVSIPEDDYHRIKGLLSGYPHAAARQVVENKDGGGGGQTASRMNVVFMSLDDQQAAAVQGVVGRYGQLSRAPCNK